MNNKLLKQKLINTGKYYQIQNARKQAYLDDKNFFINLKCKSDLLIYYKNVQENALSESIKLWYRLNSQYQFQCWKKVREYINCTFQEYKESENLRKSRAKQRKEIKDQMQFWIVMGYKIIFNTYTINEETLKIYNIELDENIDKLQSSLTRLLAQYTDDYIGNIDYGKSTDRIHFHVLEAYKPDTNHFVKEEILKTNNFNELDYTCPYTSKNKKHDKCKNLELNELQEIKIRDKYTYQLLKIDTSATTSWNSKYGFTYPELIEYNKKSYNKLPSYLSKLCSHSIKVKKKRLFKKKIKLYKTDGTLTSGSQYKEYKELREHFKASKDLASKQKYYAGQIIKDNKSEEIKEEQYEMISILEYI